MNKFIIIIALFTVGLLTSCEKNEQYKLTYNVYMGQNSAVEITYRKGTSNFDLETAQGPNELVWSKTQMVNRGFKAHLEAKLTNPGEPLTDIVVEIVEDDNVIKRQSTSSSSELRVTVGESQQ